MRVTLITSTALPEARDLGEEQPRKSSVKLYYVFILLDSERAAAFIERLSKNRLSQALAYSGVPIMAGLFILAFYLLLGSFIASLTEPAVRAVVGSLPLQSYLLIPGVNPFVPVFYGLVAIIVAVTVHEGAHGVVAFREGVRVEGAGVILLGFIPVGAYVRPSEKELATKSTTRKLSIYTAGVALNTILALVCLGLLVGLILHSVTVTGQGAQGIAVYQVGKGSPAYLAGIRPGDVITKIQSFQIANVSYLSYLESHVFRPGENVTVTLTGGRITHLVFEPSPVNSSVAIMGISPIDPLPVLREWQNPPNVLVYLAPATYGPTPLNPALSSVYHSALPAWQDIANFLFWLWWININLAVFNALPVYLLDGGQVSRELFVRIFGVQKGERVTGAVSGLVLFLLILLVVIPRAFV
jgi:membrane-associated protease RseP (regulator of RpoE activity)